MDQKKEEFSSIGKAFLLTLNVAGWIWSAVSFIPWYYISGNFKRKKPGKQQAVLTNGAYRCVANVDRLIEGYHGIQTACDIFSWVLPTVLHQLTAFCQGCWRMSFSSYCSRRVCEGVLIQTRTLMKGRLLAWTNNIMIGNSLG